MSRRFDYIVLKIRKKLKEVVFHNMSLKVMALAITLFFWFTAIGSRKIDLVKKIPVTYITSSDMVVTNAIESEVELKLSGPRAFLREISNREDTINIDLRNKKPGYVAYKVYDHMIELPIGVKVIGVYPESITPRIEWLKSKQVSVFPSFTGTLPEGYRIKSARVEPDRIETSGAQSIVEGLDRVFTEPVDISSLTAPTTRELSIDKNDRKKLNSFSTERFSVFIEVVPVVSRRTFSSVKVQVIGRKKYRVSPEYFSITVEGPKNVLDKMGVSDLNAGIDISGETAGSYVRDIVLHLPESVKNVSITPDKVKLKIF